MFITNDDNDDNMHVWRQRLIPHSMQQAKGSLPLPTVLAYYSIKRFVVVVLVVVEDSC